MYKQLLQSCFNSGHKSGENRCIRSFCRVDPSKNLSASYLQSKGLIAPYLISFDMFELSGHGCPSWFRGPTKRTEWSRKWPVEGRLPEWCGICPFLSRTGARRCLYLQHPAEEIRELYIALRLAP